MEATKANAIGLERFFGLLFEPADVVELRLLPPTRDGNGRADSQWGRADEIARHPWLQHNPAADRRGRYFGVNPRKSRGGSCAADVAGCRALVADFDHMELDEVGERVAVAGFPEPSATVMSGHGVHCYWRLDAPIEPGQWSVLQRRVIRLLGSDPAVKDPPRIMRVPGTWNTKDDAPLPVELIELSDRRYTLAEIEDHLPATLDETPPPRSNGKTTPDAIERGTRYAEAAPGATEGERSNAAYRLAASLTHDFAIPAADTLPIVARWNLKCSPPLEESELSTIVHNAERYGRNPLGEKLHGVNGASEPANDTPPPFVELMDSRDFANADFRTAFLVENVLVEGQPAVIGGRSKTLKTSIAVDLAVSLGSGTPFLNKWEATQVPVAVWSGESGAATLQETARRVADAHAVDLADCNIAWGFSLPKLARGDHLEHFERVIVDRGIRLAIVDPLYLSLLSVDQDVNPGNVYAMGGILQPLSDLATRAGVTLVVLHHFRKTGTVNPDEPCPLEELAQAGIAEWARQWLLLQRREPYASDGAHRLWLRSGGSAGHGGLWALDIDEGLISDTSGRHWDVEVSTVDNARAEVQRQREAAKARQQEEREHEHTQRLLRTLRQFREGETARVLRDTAGLNQKNFAAAIHTLLAQGLAEKCEVMKTRGRYDGFRPTPRT